MSSAEIQNALSSCSWLFGVWESVEAVAAFPTMTTTKYQEVVEFKPEEEVLECLQPLVNYKSETWHPVNKSKIHCETGFLKIDPQSRKIALVVAHNFGGIEISEGFTDKESLSLESTSISQASFLKTPDIKKIVRKWILKGEELHSTVFMETTTTPFQKHLESKYRRKK